MKRIRTKRFLRSLCVSLGLSACFLAWLLLFGKEAAKDCFEGVALCLFGMISLAMISFVAFCFVPYFRGDKRWFAIPSLLTVVFFIGTALLWQVPI